MRAFVSVDLPTTEPGDRPESAPGAPAHFTLVFLGEVPDARVPAFAEALAPRVRAVAPFTLSFGDLGAFPSPERPHVVFRGIRSGAEPLERLASAAREAARSVGLPFDARPFVPHLTLMRVRRPHDEVRAHRLLKGPAPAGPAPFEVREVLVKESLLGPAGAVHRVVHRCPLAGESAAI